MFSSPKWWNRNSQRRPRNTVACDERHGSPRLNVQETYSPPPGPPLSRSRTRRARNRGPQSAFTIGGIYITIWLLNRMAMENNRLDATFLALADPTRRAILARLRGRRGVGDRARSAIRDEPAGHFEAPEGARARRLIASATTRSGGPGASKAGLSPRPTSGSSGIAPSGSRTQHLDALLEELQHTPARGPARETDEEAENSVRNKEGRGHADDD